MKLRFLIFCLVINTFAFGEENPSLEELRWSLPLDLWSRKQEILLKGQYFRISDTNKRELSIYRSPIRSKEPDMKVNFFKLTFLREGKVLFCNMGFPEQKLTKKAYECGYRYCKPYLGSESVPVAEYAFLKWDYYTSKNKSCPLNLSDTLTYSHFKERDNHSIYTLSSESFFNIKFQSIEEDFLKVKIGDTNFYIDIGFCKEQKGICEVVNYDKSLYEYALLRLEEHKKKKDLPVLNFLIETLLPCVKKRDLNCVKKYFVTEADNNPEQFDVSNYEFKKKISLSEDDWKELEACLNYDNLLPHYIATLGLKRVCIFQGPLNSALVEPRKKDLAGLKIMDIAYPEAVRLKSSYSVYLEATTLR